MTTVYSTNIKHLINYNSSYKNLINYFQIIKKWKILGQLITKLLMFQSTYYSYDKKILENYYFE